MSGNLIPCSLHLLRILILILFLPFFEGLNIWIALLHQCELGLEIVSFQNQLLQLLYYFLMREYAWTIGLIFLFNLDLLCLLLKELHRNHHPLSILVKSLFLMHFSVRLLETFIICCIYILKYPVFSKNQLFKLHYFLYILRRN